jgi:hypothetical protein
LFQTSAQVASRLSHQENKTRNNRTDTKQRTQQEKQLKRNKATDHKKQIGKKA